MVREVGEGRRWLQSCLQRQTVLALKSVAGVMVSEHFRDINAGVEGSDDGFMEIIIVTLDRRMYFSSHVPKLAAHTASKTLIDERAAAVPPRASLREIRMHVEVTKDDYRSHEFLGYRMPTKVASVFSTRAVRIK